jgi:DNA-binding XRE family transcriptional regulator
MLNEDLVIYDSCDLIKPLIPARSRLYHLKPIGIGTPYVESLTSYIARLAEAHCLTPKLLLEKEINSPNIQSSEKKSLFGLRQYSGEINGRGETASKLVDLLEKVTLRKNLRFLTLLSWSEIFPRKKLIKGSRRWCPFCYQDFVNQNKPLYEPLIWSINVVETCSIHKTTFTSICNYCKLQLSPLASNSRIGFCSRCNKWLGKDVRGRTQNQHSFNKDETLWHIYVNENIEKLISVSNSFCKPISRDLIAHSFNLCIDRLTQGNIAAFAKMLGIPKNSVWMWSKDKSIPQIDTLLSICYHLNLSVLEFLAIEQSQPIYFKLINRDEVFHAYSDHISKNKAKAKVDSEFLEKYLLDILINKTVTPSVTEIANELGYNRRVLTRKFPELCQKISQRHIVNKKQNSQKKIKSYCLEVEAIARKLYLQGIYPTEVAVSQYIDKPGYFRYKQVRNALKHFQNNLI